MTGDKTLSELQVFVMLEWSESETRRGAVSPWFVWRVVRIDSSWNDFFIFFQVPVPEYKNAQIQ